MTAGVAQDAIRAPGTLVVGPSGSLVTGTFPYNGTEIGKTESSRS